MNKIPNQNDYYFLDYEPKLFPGLPRRVAKATTFLAKWSLIVGVVLLVVAYAPSLWYATSPDKISQVTSYLSNTVQKTASQVAEEKSQEASPQEVKTPYQPREDPNLPQTNMLIIPSVRIETQINEAPLDKYEDALKIGVWRVTDFGTPYNRELPTIMAAHKYGYLKWSVPYRLKNSFWNLEKVKVGDTVQIIWRQRKYIYEVYAEEKGESITDYSADLILYTCESLNNPVRIIKYARLLEI